MGWEVELHEVRYEAPRSVSDLAKCPYRAAYEYQFLGRDVMEKIAAAASIGSLLHQSFALSLKYNGRECRCWKEVEVPKRYGLAARVDYLCTCDQDVVVVEVKTAHEAFVDEHIRQVRIYMLMAGANKGLVVYASRDPKPKVLRVVEVDEPMSEDELLDLMNKHQMIIPIPGSYCKMCPIKTCKYHPGRSHVLP